jgi:hypothetical protein
MGIAVTDEGRLTADLETIRELRALCAEDAAELREERRLKPRVVKVGPPAGDREIESLLTSLMATAYVEAQRSFEMARSMSAAGQLIAARDLHIAQGARLCNAVSMLAIALSRRQGKPARVRVEHRHHHLHQRVV